MGKFLNYVKEVTARLTGDEAGAIAAFNARKAESALNGQIAALKAKQVDDEGTLEDAKEALKAAYYPTTKISDNKSYVEGIRRAQERVDAAQETLDNTTSSVKYYEGLIAEFDKA